MSLQRLNLLCFQQSTLLVLVLLVLFSQPKQGELYTPFLNGMLLACYLTNISPASLKPNNPGLKQFGLNQIRSRPAFFLPCVCSFF